MLNLSPSPCLTLFFSHTAEEFTSVQGRKPEHSAEEQASKQGRRNQLWQSAPAWHWSKQAYGKGKWMRNALSGKIGTWCGVLQDGLLDRSSLLFDMPCENLSAPTLLNFPLGSIYQEDTQGASSFLTFLSTLFFLLPVLHSAEQNLQWMANLAPLLCFALPSPGWLLCSLLSVLSSSCFTRWGCSDWPAASVCVCFGVGATANPLLWVVNIQDSIFGWCDWSMRWQSHAFVPWLDDWTFVNYFCQKWSLLCD